MTADIFHFPTAHNREPPANEDAERALLGAILVNNAALAHVVGILDPEHFAVEVHGRIYAIARQIIEAGGQATAITLKSHFEQDHALKDVGGVQYLARLYESAVTVLNARYYARLIVIDAARRHVMAAASDVLDQIAGSEGARAAGEIVSDAIGRFDEALASLSATERIGNSLYDAMGRALDMAEQAWREGGHVTGVTHGLHALDDLTGGLHAGELTIVAARPGQGKTALALGIAEAAARAGVNVAFFSIEMPPEQLAQRRLAAATGVSADRIRRGRFSVNEFARLNEAREAMRDTPLMLIDASGMTMQQIAGLARSLHRKRALGLVIVDYLQIVAPSAAAQRRNRVDEVTEISAGLKRLSRELRVPVVALAQLNRGLEARDNKRPRLADLRDSGAIEQDADVVLMIHREAEYLRRERPEDGGDAEWRAAMLEAEGKAIILCEKQRQGPQGVIEVSFDAARMSFTDAVNPQPEIVP